MRGGSHTLAEKLANRVFWTVFIKVDSLILLCTKPKGCCDLLMGFLDPITVQTLK